MKQLARLSSIALLIFSAAAQAQGDAEEGKRLSQVWCSSCHMTDKSGPAKDTAPPFASIVGRHAAPESWIRAWLINPHPPMPNPNLSRTEIDNIIAYLESLAHSK